MGKFDLFKLPLKSLSTGSHTFEYDLNDQYFKNIDGDAFQRGKVKVELLVKRTADVFELNFTIAGIVLVPCDRCLDNMEWEVSTKEKLYAKFGKEFSEESDNVVVIPEDEGELNIAWFLYEFIALTIPIKHVHPPGKCNKSMSMKLRKHRARSIDDEEEVDDGFDDDIIEDDVVSEETDPRWDDLKKIIDNN